MSKAALLRNVPLFAGLSDQELEALASRLGRRTFGKGMVIFHKGGLGRSLYIIESGQVRIFSLSETGQEISINIYGPGDLFGELSILDGLPRSAGAMAMERTVTLTLYRDDFLRCLEACPSMVKSIVAVLSRRLRYTTAYAETLAFLDVYGRVAAKLLELADRYGVAKAGAEQIELHLTQAELASWVVASRESVNKVLGTFRDQGLIQLEGQAITILDREALGRQVRY
jgi:CRP/FNR family cyclic AMP-dependent transcriptional regulator